MIDKVIEQSGKLLSGRTILNGVLPAGALVGIMAFLLAAGLPADPPSFATACSSLAHLTVAGIIIIVASAVLGGLLLQPLSIAITQLFEGYWWEGSLVGWIRRKRVEHYQKRRDILDQTARVTADSGAPLPSRKAEAAGWELYHFFPSRDLVLPTRLGNVLRCAEQRPGKRYGLDGIVFWPRLYPLLPDRLTVIVDDSRDQLDFAIRISGVALLGSMITFPLLLLHLRHFGERLHSGELLSLFWFAIPTGALMVAWFAYTGAVAAALQFGTAVQAAYDLHRFDLLTALHFKLPQNTTEEKAYNEQLSRFIRQDFTSGLDYHHPSSSDQKLNLIVTLSE